MFNINQEASMNEVYKLLQDCPTHTFKPNRKNNYIKYTCPSCHRPDAFVYPGAGFYSRMFCSHKGSCGFSSTVANFFNIKKEVVVQKRNEDIKKAFEDHGLDLGMLYEIGFLTDNYEIRLCKKGDTFYTKKLKLVQRKGKSKLVWWLSRDFSAQWAEFYPVINYQEQKVLWVNEGDWDFLKGIEDGLANTSSLFGCKHLPKGTGVEVFLQYEEIRILYDRDMEGQIWASKLAIHLAEKFPDKKICIVTLPFTEDEIKAGMKDYCDFRKTHSLDELLDIEFTPINVKKTKEELKRVKDMEKFLEDKEKAEANQPEFGKIYKTIRAEEKDYVICENGVYETELIEARGFSSSSFWKTKRICSDPVIMDAKLEDIFGTSSYVKLSWRGKTEKPPMEILWAKNMHKLSRMGLNILTPNAKAMSEFFLACLESVEKEIKLSTRNGWIVDNSEDDEEEQNPLGFCLGSNLVTTKSVEKIERIAEVKMKKKGKLDDWQKSIEVFLDTQTLIILGASTAAPLVEVLDISSFIIHLWGDSSTGKSIAQKISASMWGHIDQVLKQWKGTPVGLECYFQEMKNLPCFLEDSQQQHDDKVKDVSYMFANSQSKPRGGIKDGSEVGLANSRVWKTNLISSGEKKITDASNQPGLAGRTIELYRVAKEGIKINHFSRLERNLKKNYGLAGIKVIQYIIKNREALIERYETQLEYLEDILEIDNEAKIQNRQIPYWALVLLGIDINKELFGWQISNVELHQEIKKSLEATAEKRGSQNLYDFLVEHYIANESKFHKRIRGWSDSPSEGKKVGPVQLIKSEAYEAWGVYNGEKRVVYFFYNKLASELPKFGFSISQCQLLKDKGLLEHDKKRVQKSIKLEGKNVSTIALKIPEEKGGGDELFN